MLYVLYTVHLCGCDKMLETRKFTKSRNSFLTLLRHRKAKSSCWRLYCLMKVPVPASKVSCLLLDKVAGWKGA